MSLSDDDKKVWRQWAAWDKKRYERDLSMYEGLISRQEKKSVVEDKANGDKRDNKDDSLDSSHVPKKRKGSDREEASNGFDTTAFAAIPKKKSRA